MRPRKLTCPWVHSYVLLSTYISETVHIDTHSIYPNDKLAQNQVLVNLVTENRSRLNFPEINDPKAVFQLTVTTDSNSCDALNL